VRIGGTKSKPDDQNNLSKKLLDLKLESFNNAKYQFIAEVAI
jgi:hypothetical protein